MEHEASEAVISSGHTETDSVDFFDLLHDVLGVDSLMVFPQAQCSDDIIILADPLASVYSDENEQMIRELSPSVIR